MSRYVLPLVILLAAGLGGCAVERKSELVASDWVVDDRCAAIASTGDFYRYCLDVGPEQAMRTLPATIVAEGP